MTPFLANQTFKIVKLRIYEAPPPGNVFDERTEEGGIKTELSTVGRIKTL